MIGGFIYAVAALIAVRWQVVAAFGLGWDAFSVAILTMLLAFALGAVTEAALRWSWKTSNQESRSSDG